METHSKCERTYAVVIEARRRKVANACLGVLVFKRLQLGNEPGIVERDEALLSLGREAAELAFCT